MAEQDLIILRCPGYDDFLREGWWYDIGQLTTGMNLGAFGLPPGAWRAQPTNTFEVREDGVVGEVWELVRTDD